MREKKETLVLEKAKEVENTINQKKQSLLTKDQELLEIKQQRERIKEQIKHVKGQYATDRYTILNELRNTNSPEQRARLVEKFNQKMKSREGRGGRSS